MVGLARFELATNGLGNRCSIHLSYSPSSPDYTIFTTMRLSTGHLASRWVREDYKLSSSDVAAVLGTSIRYSVSEVADRNVGVIAKISKKALTPLKREVPAK